MYHCIPVALTLYINTCDFIFGKQQKYFAKEIYLYIFINLYFKCSWNQLLLYEKKVHIKSKIKETTIN